MTEIRHNFHEELAALENQLIELGNLSVAMFADSFQALKTNNQPLALTVIGRDEDAEILNEAIDARCMELLALQQPVARDLRQIVSALRIITDLERICYHAIDIAKIVRKLAAEDSDSEPFLDLSHLFELSHTLLKKSLDALAEHDLETSVQVCIEDDAVDHEFKNVRHALLGMSQTMSVGKPTSYYLLIAVYLERVADHACNIAERVHFIETGRMQPMTRSHRLSHAPGTA